MRAHHRLLRLVSRLVPRDIRDEWLAEWDAELSHREQVIDQWRAPRRSSLDLLKRASGAFWDALWLRSHRWSALRLFAREWRLATTAVLSLGTAVAAVVVGLAAYDAFLVQPPGVTEPATLRLIDLSAEQDPFGGVSFLEYQNYRTATQTFADVAAFPHAISSDTLRPKVTPGFQVWTADVSDNFFSVLGITPELGRLEVHAPQAGDLDAGDVVMGDELWRRLGADPQIVGRTIDLGGRQLRIAGIAPTSVRGMLWGFKPDVWLPLATREAMNPTSASRLNNPTDRFLHMVGRLRSGVNADQAAAEASSLAGVLASEPADPSGAHRGVVTPLSVTPPGERQWTQTILGGLLLIVMIALVVACANLTNMLLGLALARRHEMVVRAALGGSRLQLAMPLVREGATLGLAGGLVGCLLAWIGLAKLATLGFAVSPITPTISFDIRPRLAVFLVGLVIAVIAGAGASVIPAFRSAVEGAEGLVRRAAPGSPRYAIARRVLVVVQMTACTVVLAGLGLATHSLFNLRHLSLGFSARDLEWADIDVARMGYTEATSAAYFRRLVDHLAATPGVTSVSITNAAPLEGDVGTQLIAADGTATPGTATPFAIVDERYFSTIEMPILSGRNFDSRDRSGSQDVAVINQTMARTLWPDGSPLGRFLRVGKERRLTQVIGVVPDGKYGDVDETQTSYAYLALPQHFVPEIRAIARTSASREALFERLSAFDSHLALGPGGIVTLDDVLRLSMALPRAIVWAAMIIGAVALLLTMFALYSTAFYAVGQRKAEIGIRTALGASPAHLFRLMLGESARVAGVGAAVGLIAAYWLTPIAATLFVGIGNRDPIVLIGVALVCGVTTIAITMAVVRPWTRLPATALLRG